MNIFAVSTLVLFTFIHVELCESSNHVSINSCYASSDEEFDNCIYSIKASNYFNGFQRCMLVKSTLWRACANIKKRGGIKVVDSKTLQKLIVKSRKARDLTNSDNMNIIRRPANSLKINVNAKKLVTFNLQNQNVGEALRIKNGNVISKPVNRLHICLITCFQYNQKCMNNNATKHFCRGFLYRQCVLNCSRSG